jgi:hypothetical protein
VNLPIPTYEPEEPLTINECLDLMKKETVEFERQLKNKNVG